MNTPAEATLIVFVKAPRPGQVKTRLARFLGEAAAGELYRCFVADLLAMLAGLALVPRVYFYPAEAGAVMRDWLGEEYSLFPQQGDSLGDKMSHALAETFQAGADKAVLIGSDLPDLPPVIIKEALTALEQSPAVIGPGIDGGYYLIGFTAAGFTPAVFTDIPWSTETVFNRTMERFAAAGLRPYCLPAWADIDTAADLRRFMADGRGNPGRAPRTMAWLRSASISEENL